MQRRTAATLLLGMSADAKRIVALNSSRAPNQYRLSMAILEWSKMSIYEWFKFRHESCHWLPVDFVEPLSQKEEESVGEPQEQQHCHSHSKQRSMFWAEVVQTTICRPHCLAAM